jgi:hypothetical protein
MKQQGAFNRSQGSMSPAPRRRFRLIKLEDRIAPKRGGKGTNNCGGGSGTSGSSDTLDCPVSY